MTRQELLPEIQALLTPEVRKALEDPEVEKVVISHVPVQEAIGLKIEADRQSNLKN